MSLPPHKDSRAVRRPAQSRRPAAALAVVLVGGVLVFVIGFLAFWTLGSNLASGRGFALRWPSGETAGSAAEEQQRSDPGELSFLHIPSALDLRTFRDLSYIPVRGIYVTNWIAGINPTMDALISLVDRTELNAMVIDVKDATGAIGYEPEVPLALEERLWEGRIRDLDGMMDLLREHQIIPIARIVCFQDPMLAAARPDLAVGDVNGGTWKDNQGMAYTNPYKREVWKYLVDLAEDAAKRGFREIQFDYVRFPTDGPIANAVFPGENGPHEDAIADFLYYARERLEPLGVWLSADVFGHALDHKGDASIGQQLEKVAKNVDIICPMIYPSHYESGSYGISNPDRNPFDVVTFATKDATRRLEGTGAVYRPWLQDFNMPSTYSVTEVKAQIKAVEEQGYTEWLLWDPRLQYQEGALRAEG